MSEIYKLKKYNLSKEECPYKDFGCENDIISKSFPVFLDKSGKKVLFKQQTFANERLSEVFWSQICNKIKQPAAQNKLASLNIDSRGPEYGITSQIFTNDNESTIPISAKYQILNEYKNYYSGKLTSKFVKRNITFQNLCLPRFFENSLKFETDEFKKELINTYLSTYFIGDTDTARCNNISLTINKSSDGSELHHIAPNHDFQFTSLFRGTYENDSYDKAISVFLDQPINSTNYEFIRKYYPQEFARFCDRVLKLKKNSKLITLCDFSKAKGLPSENTINLDELSVRVEKDIKKRIDLITANPTL